MSISVIVATYNRAALLEQCLAQLARQAFEAGDEVVVVDNGSADATPGVLQAAAASFPVPLKALTETTPGKSRAVVAGIAASRGDVLAFTDDDVLVADDWLGVVRSLLAEGRADLVGGRVTPWWSCAAPTWLQADDHGMYGRLGGPVALIDYGPARLPLGDRTAPAGNMAIRRRVLDAAGGFPVDLGKMRGTLLSGEDHELSRRVQASGFSAVYDPRMVVRHYVPADRLRIRYYLRWFFWSGITKAAIDNRPAARSGRAPGLVRSRHWVGRIARGTGRALAAAVTAKPHAAVEAAVDVAFSLGYLTFSRGWTRTGLEPARAAGRRAEAV